jgi:indole-3-pyruvate monooxygenase
MNDTHVTTVIIGASAAGLATAACLKQLGVDYVLLEQADQVAARWRKHYDRLHLHTNRALSGLPYYPMPSDYPRFPSRDQFIKYLEDYAKKFDLAPRFGQKAVSVEPKDGEWITQTQDSAYHSHSVVIATGNAGQPQMPSFTGMEQFQGTILHSRDYKNGAAYKGKSVLVVGFGNSGGEIAIDLFEHGAKPALSVRSAVNIIPREIAGIPVIAIRVYSPNFPPAFSDLIFKPLISMTIGDVTKLGLRKLPYGPLTQIDRDKHIPLIDVGTVKHIREGHITVYPGISRFNATGIVFEDGRELAADAVVMATGYRPALHDFLPIADRVIDSSGTPLVSGRESTVAGLYFCGFYLSPTGMLREIGIEAQRIAKAIAKVQQKPIA